MMKVKYMLCTECKHPLDDHSAYRPICLHTYCSCKVGIPDTGATGSEYPSDDLSQLNQLKQNNNSDMFDKILEKYGV